MADIIVLVCWKDVSGQLPLPSPLDVANLPRATPILSELLTPLFLAGGSFPGLDRPLAEFPSHLVGHSRGASLVGQIALQLGRRGVRVDDVTTLDPRPVDGECEPLPLVGPLSDWGDPMMDSIDNVVFWDNYWRTDGCRIGSSGEQMANTHDVQLIESILEDGGYSALGGAEHADVHLFYHGTVDTSPSDFHGSEVVPPEFYDSPHPERNATGYIWSRTVGEQRPVDGLEARFQLGGTAHRTPVELDEGVDAWPNIDVIQASSEVTDCEEFDVSYIYENADSASEIRILLDRDRDSRNGNFARQWDVEKNVPATGGQVVRQDLTVSAEGLAAGLYYVLGHITDLGSGNERFAYAPLPLRVSPCIPQVCDQLRLAGLERDDGAGDDDGVPEPGEAVRLRVALGSSVGSEQLTDVSATLRVDPPGCVVIQQNFTHFSPVPPGGTSKGQDTFDMTVSAVAASTCRFTLDVGFTHDGTVCRQSVSFSRQSCSDCCEPEIILGAIRIDDSAARSPRNNGDGRIQSGEKVRILTELCNVGRNSLQGVTATLVPSPDTERIAGLEFPTLPVEYPDLLSPAPCERAGGCFGPAPGASFRIDLSKAPGFTGVLTFGLDVTGSVGAETPVWSLPPGPIDLVVEPAAWISLSHVGRDLGQLCPGEPAMHDFLIGNPGSAAPTISSASVQVTPNASATLTPGANAVNVHGSIACSPPIFTIPAQTAPATHPDVSGTRLAVLEHLGDGVFQQILLIDGATDGQETAAFNEGLLVFTDAGTCSRRFVDLQTASTVRSFMGRCSGALAPLARSICYVDAWIGADFTQVWL